MDPHDSAMNSGTRMGPPNKSLARSISQPAIFPGKFEKRNLIAMRIIHKKGPTESSGNDSLRHEDDLDIIKQIIDKDQLTDDCSAEEDPRMHSRSLSLSHIPRAIDFSNDIGSMSLPTLHHAESMCMLHTNYNSAPDCSQLGSPPTYENSIGKPPPSLPPLSLHVGTLNNTSCHSSLSDLQSIDHLGGESTPPPPNFSKRRGSGFEGGGCIATPGYCSNSAQNTPGYDIQPQSSPAFEFTDIRTNNLQQQGSTTNNTTAATATSEGSFINSPPSAFEFMSTSSAAGYSGSGNDDLKLAASSDHHHRHHRLSFSEQEDRKNISDIMTSFKVTDSSSQNPSGILGQQLQGGQSQISSSNDPLSSYLGEGTVSPPLCAVTTSNHSTVKPRPFTGHPASSRGGENGIYYNIIYVQ